MDSGARAGCHGFAHPAQRYKGNRSM